MIRGLRSFIDSYSPMYRITARQALPCASTTLTNTASRSNASRSRVVILGSIGMFASRVFGFVASFFVIGILSRGLTQEAFGLWAIMSSFAFFASSFDFGLGQAMRNKLAEMASGPDQAARRERDLFFAVLTTLVLVCGLVGAAIALIFPHLPWASWFNAQSPAITRVIPMTATVVAVSFVGCMPLGLSYAGFLAYQEAGRRSFFDAIQSLMLLLTVVLFASRLPIAQLIAVYYLVFLLSQLIALVSFVWRRRWRPVWVSFGAAWGMVRPLASRSVLFWFLGMSWVLIFTTDPAIAGRVLGLASAGDFNVVQKLFTVIITVHFTVLTPLWSAYTQAAHVRDWAWIDRSLRRSLWATVIVLVLGASALALLSGPLLEFWVGRKIDDPSLVASFVVWTAVYAVINCYSILLSGLGRLRRQTALAGSAALLHWPLSLWLGSTIGAAGIVLGTVAVILPLGVSNILEVRSVLKEHSVN